MISERELWACANQVLAQHGEAADKFVAARIRSLAAAADAAGVKTWMAIADRLDRLRLVPADPDRRH